MTNQSNEDNQGIFGADTTSDMPLGEATSKGEFLAPQSYEPPINTQKIDSISGEKTAAGFSVSSNPVSGNIFDRRTTNAIPTLTEEGETIGDLVGDLANAKLSAAPNVPKEPTNIEVLSAFKNVVKQRFIDLSEKYKQAKAKYATELEAANLLFDDVKLTIADVVNALPQEVRIANKTELKAPASALYFIAKYLGTMNTVINGLNSKTTEQSKKIEGLEGAVKSGQADYELAAQNMHMYETVVDFLINFASKPQYASRLKASDTKFLSDAKKGSSADLPRYACLLNLLSQFVDEDSAHIEILQAEDKKYKSLDADYKKLSDEHATAQSDLKALEIKIDGLTDKLDKSSKRNSRLFDGLKNVADKYASRKDAHETAVAELEIIAAQNKELRDSAAKTSEFLKETFAEFDAYIAEVEKSME